MHDTFNLASAIAGSVATAVAFAGVAHLFRWPPATPSDSTLAAINRKLDDIMTELSDAETAEAADLAALSGKIDQAVTLIAGFPGAVSAAVAKALADAGVDDAAALAATQAADALIKAESDKLAAVLNPPAPDPNA